MSNRFDGSGVEPASVCPCEILDSLQRCLGLVQAIMACMRRNDLYSNEVTQAALLDARDCLQKELEKFSALQFLAGSNPETSLYS